MLASFPASMMNEISADLAIPNRFRLNHPALTAERPTPSKAGASRDDRRIAGGGSGAGTRFFKQANPVVPVVQALTFFFTPLRPRAHPILLEAARQQLAALEQFFQLAQGQALGAGDDVRPRNPLERDAGQATINEYLRERPWAIRPSCEPAQGLLPTV